MDNLLDIEEIRDLFEQKLQRENRASRSPEVEVFCAGLIIGLIGYWSYITYLS